MEGEKGIISENFSSCGRHYFCLPSATTPVMPARRHTSGKRCQFAILLKFIYSRRLGVYIEWLMSLDDSASKEGVLGVVNLI